MDKIELIDPFRKHYGTDVNPELISLKICQTSDSCFLETVLASAPSNVIRQDTDFIMNGNERGEDPYDNLLFHPKHSIAKNARHFIELDPFSLINCFDHLFTKEADEKIITEHVEGNRSE